MICDSYPRSDELSWKSVVYYLRIQKIKPEQPSASAYVLCLCKLYWLHILEENCYDLKVLRVGQRTTLVYE